jgi:hypothetical protein
MIVDLLAPTDCEARAELHRVGGVASTLIASEAAKNDPVIAYGAGPRVRVFCLYDESAVTGDGANEQHLPSSPTDGDWRVSIPCPEEDMKWVSEALAERSARITARALGQDIEPAPDSETESANALSVDPEAFLRP